MEKSNRERDLVQARASLSRGEAPSEDAAAEWNRQERRRVQVIEAELRAAEESSIDRPVDMPKVRWIVAAVTMDGYFDFSPSLICLDSEGKIIYCSEIRLMCCTRPPPNLDPLHTFRRTCRFLNHMEYFLLLNLRSWALRCDTYGNQSLVLSSFSLNVPGIFLFT